MINLDAQGHTDGAEPGRRIEVIAVAPPTGLVATDDIGGFNGYMWLEIAQHCERESDCRRRGARVRCRQAAALQAGCPLQRTVCYAGEPTLDSRET
jgi:hypothetical protein